MKKLTLIFTLLITATFGQAQEIVTEFWHENGLYCNIHNIVEANDNTLLVECPLFESFAYGIDLGNMFYKVSLEGELLDSLFIASDNVPLRTLFEPVPNDDKKYIYGRVEQQESDSTTYLRLTTIDKDLNILSELEVSITDFLYDYVITSSDLFIDPYGDIIASYWCQQKFYMLRIGIDGTIKHHRMVEEMASSGLMIQSQHTNVFCESPLTYYYLGWKISNNGGLQAYFIDSLFQVTDEHLYYKTDSYSWFSGGLQEHIVPFDNSTHLLASRYKMNYTHECTALTMFDNQFNLLKMKWFEEEPPFNSIAPIQTIVAAPDTIYYGFMTGTGSPNQLALACFDADLNLRWTRYFLEPDMFHWATCMTLLHDGNVAIGSYRYGQNLGSISVVIIKDELWDVDENQDFIRPYACFPNPVADELHLTFSPDVTPMQIELYDLQGRLVRAQKNGLGSLNMSDLPSGTYTMRVKMEDGKVFSDKIVKKS